jgi:hypothetical protein
MTGPDAYITWGMIVVGILGTAGLLAVWLEGRGVDREKKRAGKT